MAAMPIALSDGQKLKIQAQMRDTGSGELLRLFKTFPVM